MTQEEFSTGQETLNQPSQAGQAEATQQPTAANTDPANPEATYVAPDQTYLQAGQAQAYTQDQQAYAQQAYAQQAYPQQAQTYTQEQQVQAQASFDQQGVYPNQEQAYYGQPAYPQQTAANWQNQPAYANPYQPYPVMPEKSSVPLILGIIAIVLDTTWFLGTFGFILALIGLILAIINNNQDRRYRAEIVLNSIALVIPLFWVILFFVLVGASAGF